LFPIVSIAVCHDHKFFYTANCLKTNGNKSSQEKREG